MSESGLYAPAYAALALKQAEGSIEEAVFLLRAYRSNFEPQLLYPAGQRDRDARCPQDLGSL